MTRRAQSGPADARRTSGVACAALAPFVVALSQAAGMSAANAAILADVYVRSTLRGVGHHDICDLPLRIAAFREGRMNPDPRITPCGGSDAVEAWDGDNGPGELCAVHVVQRAQALASCHGIGLATIRSSNHFLAAAPYVQMAAERGYLAQFAMSDAQREAVLDRDYNRMIALGGNIYFLAKIGATDGHSFQNLAAKMTGMSEEAYRSMMIAGGRPAQGHRSRSDPSR